MGLMTDKPFKPIQVESYSQLQAEESAIISRINSHPRGGLLFMSNPFMLLEEIGVRISEDLKRELLRISPFMAALSPVPYRALQQSKSAGTLRVVVKGLFKPRSVKL
jgi:hypothetical protein